MVAVETLAAVVSVESGFAPFAIRINTDHRPPLPARSKSEAIQAATALIADGADIDLGLGGINVSALQKSGVSIADAFDPCINLRTTATLLDGYYRVAVKNGATATSAERTMLNAYYGGGDTEGGELAGFDKQVLSEREKLAQKIAELKIGPVSATGAFKQPITPSASADFFQDVTAPRGVPAPQDLAIAHDRDTTRSQPTWDVFGADHNPSTIVFNNINRSNQE